MTGCKNGLKGILKNNTDFLDFIPIYCIIHIEYLTAKYFKYEQVMNVIHFCKLHTFKFKDTSPISKLC
jgi:hypothetical protein